MHFTIVKATIYKFPLFIKTSGVDIPATKPSGHFAQVWRLRPEFHILHLLPLSCVLRSFRRCCMSKDNNHPHLSIRCCRYQILRMIFSPIAVEVEELNTRNG